MIVSIPDHCRLSYFAVRYKAVVLLLVIYCLMYFPIFVGGLCLYLFCYALLCVHSSFAITLKRKRKLVAIILLFYRCFVTINVLWLFLTVPWVGLQCVIVVFSNHTRLFLYKSIRKPICECILTGRNKLSPVLFFSIAIMINFQSLVVFFKNINGS